MRKILKVLGYSFLGILLVGLIGTGIFVYKVKYGFPLYDKTPPTLPITMKDFSVLVFSKTNGFPHSEAIASAIPAFEAMAKKNDWTIYPTNNAAVFNPEQLAKFDVVIWSNATGRNLTDEQRIAFRQYIENGGGFLGIHGAGDASHHWDWYYNELIGAHFSHHPLDPQLQVANLHLACDSTSSYPCMDLPATFKRSDEWYVFFDNPRTRDFKVLYTLEEQGIEMSGNIKYLVDDKDFGMGADHPIIWYKCLPNGGRTFYSAMGHTGASFQEPIHLTILEKGVQWAGKLVGDCE